jgi:copper transport protein
MAVWVGGLVALVAAVPAGTRRLPGPDRTRLLAAVLLRFSPLALWSVAVVLATGIAQSLVEIDAWSQLTDTAFGRAVLIKLVLLLVLVGLGAINRRRNVPRFRALAEAGETPGEDGVVLRRTLRAEVAIMAVVIAVTGALGGYPPAKSVAAGPFSVTTSIGPEQLQLTLDPAKPGSNELHVYLLDPKTGAQFDRTKTITIEATQPDKGIGPLTLDAEKAGPGHYVVSSAVLGAPGTWKIRVVSLVSDFDEYEKTVDVALR